MPVGGTFNPQHGLSDPYLEMASTFFQERIGKNLMDLTLTKKVLWDKLESKAETITNAPAITESMQLGTYGGAGFFGGSERINTSQRAIFATGQWGWSNIRCPVYIPWDQWIAARGNKAKMGDLIKALADAAQRYMYDALGHAIYWDPNLYSTTYDGTHTYGENTASGFNLDSNMLTMGMNGLSEIIREDPNNQATIYHTYGGLSTAQWPVYVNQVHPSTYQSVSSVYRYLRAKTVPISLAAFQEVQSRCERYGGNIDWHITTRNAYNQWYQNFAPQQLLMVSSTQRVGYKALIINDIEVTADPHCPSYADSEQYIKFGEDGAYRVNPSYAMARAMNAAQGVAETSGAEYGYFIDSSTIKMAFDGNFKNVATPFTDMMPGRELGYLSLIGTRCNMWCTDRRHNGVIRWTTA